MAIDNNSPLQFSTDEEWAELVAKLNEMVKQGSPSTLTDFLQLHAEAMKKFNPRRLARLYEHFGLQEIMKDGPTDDRQDGTATE